MNDKNLYYKNQITNAHRIEENKIRKLVEEHIIQSSLENNIKVDIFYKNKKLKNLSIKNKLFDKEPVNDSGVYKFTCPKRGCHASYIGNT